MIIIMDTYIGITYSNEIKFIYGYKCNSKYKR